jgi:hypothetical protein
MSWHPASTNPAQASRRLTPIVLLLALPGCGGHDQPGVPAPAATTTAAAPTTRAAKTGEIAGTPTRVPAKPGLLLTEILYRPATGAAQFIELENLGREAVPLKPLALMIDAEAVPLEEAGEQLAPGARLLVILDGPRRAEGPTYHVGEDIRMSAEAGRAAIVDPLGKVIDDVAWGLAPGAVNPSAGGGKTDIAPGESIGRPPGATSTRSPVAWVGYAAGEVSPGKANPPAAVRTLHPMSGARMGRHGAAMSWFSVPGATGYRVQVAADESFARIVLDRSIDRPRLDVSSLPAGRYAWRVQSRFHGDISSAYSATAIVTLLETSAAEPGGNDRAGATQAVAAIDTLRTFGRRAFEIFLPAVLAQAPTAPVRNAFACPQAPVALLQEACWVTGVPLIKQHKDTQMLLLEQAVHSGDPHPWDADHGDLDENDPADNANCGLASLAMMNRHAGGDLNQDRIGYEVLEGMAAGPEGDLMHGDGLWPQSQMLKAYAFALGTTPTLELPKKADRLWADMKGQIERRRPMLVYSPSPSHFFVIAGYRLRGGHRVFLVNDPWDGFVEIDLDDAVGGRFAATWYYYLPGGDFVPMRQEATVLSDADGDEVVDFDETERFHTNPGDNDTDADGVADKADIAASVFDGTYGYALHRTGRDEDHDGRAMELDPDSDAGGCKDGDEDRNGNGIYEGAVLQAVETWNFKFLDDSCRGLAGHVTRRFRQSGLTNQIIETSDSESWTGISVRLKPVDGEPGYYEDDGSRYQYTGSLFVRYIVGTCRVNVRNWTSSSGDFIGEDAAPATAQITDDGRLAMHFVAGIPNDHTGGWMAGCKLGGSGYSNNPPSAEFPDECWGEPVQPGQQGFVPGQKVFHFNCHSQHWDATGTVAVP